MKTINYLLILFLTLSLGACSSDDDSSNNSQEIDENDNNSPENLSYNFFIDGKYQVDWCETTNNTANIKITFLEDDEVKSSLIGQSDTEVNESFEEDLNGNIIGVKLELKDFDPNDLEAGSMGDGFESISIRITNNITGEIIADEDINGYYLVHCADVAYEVKILYNISSQDLEVSSKTEGF